MERQNDFGGTVGGPLVHDRTFFFFSYEGLRLRLPQVALDTVPDEIARESGLAAMQPYLNAFPLDPNQPDLGNGIAQYNASYSNAATLERGFIDEACSSRVVLHRHSFRSAPDGALLTRRVSSAPSST